MNDHNIIFFSLAKRNESVRSVNKFKKYDSWKQNETVLEDQQVDEYILNKCKYINKLQEKHKYEWYEYFISEIIKM